MSARSTVLCGLALSCCAIAVLPACGKKKTPGPTAPAADSNAALYGTWIGSLTGPSAPQPSGWSSAFRDSVWVVFKPNLVKFYMIPFPGSDTSLSPPPDTCFAPYLAALNSESDPHVSFRVSLFSLRIAWGSVDFNATRSGNALTGTMTLPGDTTAGTWTAALCGSCPDTAKLCKR